MMAKTGSHDRNNEKEFEQTDQFSCNFCYKSFSTNCVLNEHIESHLIRQQCSCCNKSVIIIGGQLYELHVPTSAQGVRNSNNYDVGDIKREETVESVRIYLDDSVVEPKVEVEELDVPLEDTELISNVRGKRFRPRKDVKYASSESGSETQCKIRPKTKRKSNKPEDESDENPEEVSIKREQSKTKSSGVSKCFDCPGCDRKFQSERGLKQHEERQHKEKPTQTHECDICGRILKTAQYLREHKRTHSTEKRFICNYCGKGFHVKFHLKEHTYIHTGERPYKCDFCDKMFNRTTLKYSHQRMHTGQKPFKCDVDSCDKAYSFSVDLKRHRRAQHQIFINCKRFECPVCAKVFYENKFLKQHMTTHRVKD